MSSEKVPEELAKCLKPMRDWLKTQNHLPQDIDDVLLLRFAHSCYFDIERAKAVADLFFTWRAASPDLLSNRDPLSPHMQKILNSIDIAQYEIPGNRLLWVWQLNDPGLENYEYILDIKLFLVTSDAWLLNSTIYPDGVIILLDVKDVTLKFLSKFNVSIARRAAKYQQEAMPIRLKQVHIVNAPSFIDKIYAMMKPFMRKEVTESIYFHPPMSDSLFQHFAKDDLPEEFGGTRESIKKLKPNAISGIIGRRELLNENLWVATDKKKGDVTMDTGSFRSLVID